MKPRVIIVLLVSLIASVILMTGCGLSNKPPEISSLTPSTISVTPGGSCTITCTAGDPDGDTLTYQWDATGGMISGNGNSVTWTAPGDVGSYNVSVTVNDGHGNNAMNTITIPVTSIPPASIGIIPIQ